MLSCSFRNIAGFIGNNTYKTFIGLSNELFDHHGARNPKNLVLNGWTGIFSISSHLSKVFFQSFVPSIHGELKKLHKIFLVCGMPTQRILLEAQKRTVFTIEVNFFIFCCSCVYASVYIFSTFHGANKILITSYKKNLNRCN